MQFAQRPPCPALRPWVRFYWTVEDLEAVPAAVEVIVPDGCMEMIFHFGAPLRTVDEGVGALHPRAMVGGQITRSMAIRPSGPIGMLGVRFHPAGAQPLLRMPMDGIAGETVDAVKLIGAAAADTVDRLAASQGAGARFDIVEALMLRLLRRAAPVDPLALASIEALAASHGTMPIQRLATRLQVSPRHLNRVLRRHVGIGAKPFARIMRLQFALAAMRRGDAASLADAACAAGYFDQAHFNRDFQAFCGTSPGRYIGQRHALADSFG